MLIFSGVTYVRSENFTAVGMKFNFLSRNPLRRKEISKCN